MILFVVIGLVALAVAAWQGWRTTAFMRDAVRTTATVVADAPGSTAVVSAGYPMVEFTTPKGRVVRFRQNGMGPTRIGERLALRYLPADPPGTATAEDFWTMWSGTILPLIMGLGFISLPLAGASIGFRPGRY